MFDRIMFISMMTVWLGLHIACNWQYKRIHGVAAKWWAIPSVHGALLWSRRLPPRWEKTK